MNVAAAFDVCDGPISHVDISDIARNRDFATAAEKDDGLFTKTISRERISREDEVDTCKRSRTSSDTLAF